MARNEWRDTEVGTWLRAVWHPNTFRRTDGEWDETWEPERAGMGRGGGGGEDGRGCAVLGRGANKVSFGGPVMVAVAVLDALQPCRCFASSEDPMGMRQERQERQKRRGLRASCAKMCQKSCQTWMPRFGRRSERRPAEKESGGPQLGCTTLRHWSSVRLEKGHENGAKRRVGSCAILAADPAETKDPDRANGGIPTASSPQPPRQPTARSQPPPKASA